MWVVTFITQRVLLSIILSFFSKLPLCLLILPGLRTSLLLYQIFLPYFSALCQGVAGTRSRGCVSQDRQTCLVVLPLFLCTLQAWGVQQHEPLVALHHFILSHGMWWHEGSLSHSTAFSLALAVVGTSSSCPALAVPLMLGSTTFAAL